MFIFISTLIFPTLIFAGIVSNIDQFYNHEKDEALDIEFIKTSDTLFRNMNLPDFLRPIMKEFCIKHIKQSHIIFKNTDFIIKHNVLLFKYIFFSIPKLVNQLNRKYGCLKHRLCMCRKTENFLHKELVISDLVPTLEIKLAFYEIDEELNSKTFCFTLHYNWFLYTHDKRINLNTYFNLVRKLSVHIEILEDLMKNELTEHLNTNRIITTLMLLETKKLCQMLLFVKQELSRIDINWSVFKTTLFNNVQGKTKIWNFDCTKKYKCRLVVQSDQILFNCFNFCFVPDNSNKSKENCGTKTTWSMFYKNMHEIFSIEI